MGHEHLSVQCKGCKQTYCIRCGAATADAPHRVTTHAVHDSIEPGDPS